jgi:CRP-like cAMP-binding protein
MSTGTLDPLARKLESYATFQPGDREALLALPHDVKTYEAASYLVREGDVTTRSCVMLSGFTYRHKVVADVAIHMRGDMVDLQNSILRVADHNVQALTTSQIAFIPREAVKRIAFERPRIGLAMWYDTLVDGSIFREWIANVGRRDSRTRLAHVLCEFALRLETAGLGTHTEWGAADDSGAACRCPRPYVRARESDPQDAGPRRADQPKQAVGNGDGLGGFGQSRRFPKRPSAPPGAKAGHAPVGAAPAIHDIRRSQPPAFSSRSLYPPSSAGEGEAGWKVH